MADEADEPVPPVPWGALRPYLSVVILECTADDPALSFGALTRILRDLGSPRFDKETRVAAVSELNDRDNASIEGLGNLEMLGLNQLFGCVQLDRMPPSWADESTGYIDVEHRLLIALRWGNLIAVHADRSTHDRIQRKLDKPPLPPLRRLSPKVLESAFMRGDAKSLWLRSVQRRSAFRPDGKAIDGPYLQATLDPNEDNSFAMNSVRCDMPDDPSRVFVKGSIGVTVHKSLVWLKACADFPTYLAMALELLQIAKNALTNPEEFSAFPYLAQEVFDLSEVSGAYEALALHPDQLAATGSGSEVLDAATLLQDAVIEVREGSKGARFKVDVGLGGASSGRLVVNLRRRNNRFSLDIGWDSSCPSPLAAAEAVLTALTEGDVLEFYFESGHKYSNGRIWKTNFTPHRFPGWDWKDFAGYTITSEKPAGLTATQEIHDAIGRNGDRSLFAWTASHWRTGWLTCDDGSGEAADFFHLDNDGTFRIIHIKAAKSTHPRRQVRATAYETVVGQTSKNLLYLERERLVDRLAGTNLANPACWTFGTRVDGHRSDFLQALAMSKASDRTEIVIVQPHLSKQRYETITRDEENGLQNQNILRLQLLEMLLKTTRTSVVKYGAELRVIGGLL